MEKATTTRKILLIDDDADDRKYFQEAVNEIDPLIECVTAKDGLQAMDMLNNLQLSLPEFIFIDLRMPRISGKQCLLKIKTQDRLKHIPVVVYTTSREVEESEELQAMGAIHFVSKPTDPEELFYVVSQVLEEHGAVE